MGGMMAGKTRQGKGCPTGTGHTLAHGNERFGELLSKKGRIIEQGKLARDVLDGGPMSQYRTLLWAATVATGLVACGGDVNGTDGVGGDAGSAGAAGSGGTTGTGGVGGGTDSGGGGAGGVSGAGAAAGAGGGDPPVDVASTHTVTVELTNTSGDDRFVVTSGMFCTDYDIAVKTANGYGSLPLEIGFQCMCECANPGSPRAVTYHRIKSGESWPVSWDGRKLVTYKTDYDCAQHGWPGAGIQQELHGVMQPVGPGEYRWTLGVETVLPEECTSSDADGNEFQCYGGYPMPGPPTMNPIAEVCPSAAPVSVDFTLPASGDINVAVALP